MIFAERVNALLDRESIGCVDCSPGHADCPLAAWLLPQGGGRRKLWTLSQTRSSMDMLFGEDLHLARVRSLANGVAGVLNASVVSIAAIGRAYARLAMIESKSGVKQIDRLLSNEQVKIEEVMPLWVKHVVGTTQNIVLAIDWTDFDATTTRRSARIWSRRTVERLRLRGGRSKSRR